MFISVFSLNIFLYLLMSFYLTIPKLKKGGNYECTNPVGTL